MDKKPNAIFWLIGSMILIFLAIAMTAIISQNKTTATSTDIRSRASAVGSLVFTGTIASVDRASRTISVNNLKFANNADNNLGAWSVLVPTNTNYTGLTPGKSVNVYVDPATFDVASHVLKALEVK